MTTLQEAIDEIAHVLGSTIEPWQRKALESAHEALRAALAQQGEPVAWKVVTFNSKTTKSFLTKPEAMNYLMFNDADGDWHIEPVLAAAPAPQTAPVAWVWNPASIEWEKVRAFGHWQQGALYAFGPTQPEPLAAPAPQAQEPCPNGEPCKHGAWCTEVYCQELCEFRNQPAPQAQQGERKNCPQPEICGSKECEFCRDTAAPAQKPAAYITPTEQGPMVWTLEMYDEACTYCDDGEFPVPLYTAAHGIREVK